MRFVFGTFVVCVVLSACSTPDIGAPPYLTGSVVSKKDGGDDDDTKPSSTKEACTAKTESLACWSCCHDEHPFSVDLVTPIFKCDCEKCATECAQSLCGDFAIQPAPGDPCDVCIKANEKTCNAVGDTACAADVSCAKFAACGKTAGCEGKP